MNNQSMQNSLESGDTIDVSSCSRLGDYYIIENMTAEEIKNSDLDFCNKVTERWIWSIGQNKDGQILASEGADLYQNPEFECLWLR